jgi:hypothetical protein
MEQVARRETWINKPARGQRWSLGVDVFRWLPVDPANKLLQLRRRNRAKHSHLLGIRTQGIRDSLTQELLRWRLCTLERALPHLKLVGAWCCWQVHRAVTSYNISVSAAAPTPSAASTTQAARRKQQSGKMMAWAAHRKSVP